MQERTIELILGLAWPIVTMVLGSLTLWTIYVLCMRLHEGNLPHKDKTRRDWTKSSTEKDPQASGTDKGPECPGDKLEPKRPRWQWIILSFVLIVVLVVGILAILIDGNNKGAIYLFATAAFSIAYALHFLSVSIGINGVLLGQKDEIIRDEIRKKAEYPIVTSGMKALGGGLGILLSGGLLLLTESILYSALVYFAGAFFLAWSVLKYAWTLRGWPRIILNIISGDGKHA